MRGLARMGIVSVVAELLHGAFMHIRSVFKTRSTGCVDGPSVANRRLVPGSCQECRQVGRKLEWNFGHFWQRPTRGEGCGGGNCHLDGDTARV